MSIDEENTFRALKDEPMIARWGLLCKLNWHTWTEWSEAYIPQGGKFNIQHRHCATCNKMEIRRVSDLV